MADAQLYFELGVVAIEQEKDVVRGRKMLAQSLKMNPRNDMAWLYLARTLNDQHLKLRCVRQARTVNPGNEEAVRWENLLVSASQPMAVAS
ncbi:MAG: hypothetical protein SF029_22830 [bacterium]|nr:hypothetical protein [bacterium]